MDLVKKRPGYWDNAESHLCAVGPVVHALLVFDSPEEAAEFIDQVARQVAQFAKQTAPPASPEAAQTELGRNLEE